ncbi:MAG: anti-sigma-factor antagonist [Actinomycetia bacterium]|nr:anti-sigma-factor antagonist [Actinomycetes bacterium]
MHTWFTERPVGGIRPGDHAWLPFATGEEQEHIVGTFVRDGLTTSEKVVYIGDGRPIELPGLRDLRRLDPNRYAETGQLRVIAREQACMTRGRLDPDQMLATFEREISIAFDEGYRAVRITTDLTWALCEPGGSDLMLSYEAQFEAAVGPSTRAMAICQINRNSCAPDQLIELEHTHEVLVAADPEFDDGTLRMTKTFDPYGLRLEGELDWPRHTVFAETLVSVTGTKRRVHLDFAGIRFVDLGSLEVLAVHATRLPRDHDLVLDNLPPEIEGVIEMVGWHRFPGVSRGRGMW